MNEENKGDRGDRGFTGPRGDRGETGRAFARVGPFSIDPKVNITGVLAMAMALSAMVGGWYKFSYRLDANEHAITMISDEERQHTANEQRINDTLNRTNSLMSQVMQALDDRKIHIQVDPSFRPDYLQGGGISSDAPSTPAPPEAPPQK